MLWGLKIITIFLTSALSYEYGIDRLGTPEVSLLLQNKRLAVLAHAASVDHQGNHLIDLLKTNYSLLKIFVPEHGLRTLDDDWIQNGVDEKSGLPVISLYQQKSRAPKIEDLQDIDAIVIDLQDVGVRYYTYFSTIAEFVKVAADAHKEIILLDRPNVMGGEAVEGETLDLSLTGNFISYLDIPTRHGLTLGELTQLLIAEKKIPLKLSVVTVKDWHREATYSHADRAWVPSSPALLNLEQVFLYTLWGSLEHFNLSVGRGLTNELAFKVAAAPWITVKDSQNLATALNDLGLKGVTFLPYTFTSSRVIYVGQEVNGVQIALSEGYETNRSDEVTYRISETLEQMFLTPLKFSTYAANYYGSKNWVNSIQKNESWGKILPGVDAGIQNFLERRKPYLLY